MSCSCYLTPNFFIESKAALGAKMKKCLAKGTLSKRQATGAGFTELILDELSKGILGNGSYKVFEGNKAAGKLVKKLNKARDTGKVKYKLCCVELRNDQSKGNKNGCFEGKDGCQIVKKECVDW